jgi:hypothetical protein
MIGIMHASILRVGSGSEKFPSLCEKYSLADAIASANRLKGRDHF